MICEWPGDHGYRGTTSQGQRLIHIAIDQTMQYLSCKLLGGTRRSLSPCEFCYMTNTSGIVPKDVDPSY